MTMQYALSHYSVYQGADLICNSILFSMHLWTTWLGCCFGLCSSLGAMQYASMHFYTSWSAMVGCFGLFINSGLCSMLVHNEDYLVFYTGQHALLNYVRMSSGYVVCYDTLLHYLVWQGKVLHCSTHLACHSRPFIMLAFTFPLLIIFGMQFWTVLQCWAVQYALLHYLVWQGAILEYSVCQYALDVFLNCLILMGQYEVFVLFNMLVCMFRLLSRLLCLYTI